MKIPEQDLEILGCKATDRITGFVGWIVMVTHYHSGCTHVGLQSNEKKDGIPVDVIHFNIGSVEINKSDRVCPQIGQSPPSGPMPAPPSN